MYCHILAVYLKLNENPEYCYEKVFPKRFLWKVISYSITDKKSCCNFYKVFYERLMLVCDCLKHGLIFISNVCNTALYDRFLKKTLHCSCHNLQIVCHKLSLNCRHVQTSFWKSPSWLDFDKQSPHVSNHFNLGSLSDSLRGGSSVIILFLCSIYWMSSPSCVPKKRNCLFSNVGAALSQL